MLLQLKTPFQPNHYPMSTSEIQAITDKLATYPRFQEYEQNLLTEFAQDWAERGFTAKTAEQWLKADVWDELSAHQLTRTGITPADLKDVQIEWHGKTLTIGDLYSSGWCSLDHVRQAIREHKAQVASQNVRPIIIHSSTPADRLNKRTP